MLAYFSFIEFFLLKYFDKNSVRKLPFHDILKIIISDSGDSGSNGEIIVISISVFN